MTTFTEAARVGEFIKREWDRLFNRETVTVASGQNLAGGTVVGRITASGKIVVYDNNATDGSQTAVGVLIAPVDASAGDTKGVILARGPAVVSKAELVWGAGVTSQGEKDAAYAELAALQIIARDAITGGPVSIA